MIERASFTIADAADYVLPPELHDDGQRYVPGKGLLQVTLALGVIVIVVGAALTALASSAPLP